MEMQIELSIAMERFSYWVPLILRIDNLCNALLEFVPMKEIILEYFLHIFDVQMLVDVVSASIMLI